ncbi:hypothetical protein [Novosphingobium sp.]|jgi:hypothetical protein|uniref:hypothetical protein n=1 Tax=Novosphingobium sp. TaxID=1874826 RepID=UPI002FE35E49
MRLALGLSLCLAAVLPAVPVAAADKVIRTMDLSAPFQTRSPWQFIATQGAEEEDPSGDTAPGPITPCITRDKGATCNSAATSALRLPGSDDVFSTPHFISRLEVVHAKAEGETGRSLLLLQLASFQAGNGDRRVALQLYAYDRAKDAFTAVFTHRTGRNNNQELRYVEAGPLRGNVITAEPTQDAPYGYWITVHKPAASGQYGQALRFRSATAYGDGNPLAVIDSEMPNILKRLGLWRAGMPLPLPAGECPRPHLVGMALWCR